MDPKLVNPWGDADLLNNPEKLMSLKWTEADLELAKSTTDFFEQTDLIRELVLQDSRLAEMLEKHTLGPARGSDEQSAVQTIDNIVEAINNVQKKCSDIISEFKNKPFWTSKEKEAILNETHRDQVMGWIKIVERFENTFEAVRKLRVSRRSMIPTLTKDPQADKLVQQLGDIYKELSGISKIFDDIET